MTGGAGFIGSHLVDRLLDRGRRGDRRRQLRPVLRPRRQGGQPGAGPGATPGSGWSSSTSATRPGSTRWSRESRPDAIVHLAARAGVRPSIDDPAALRRRQRRGHRRPARGRLPARAPAAVRLRLELERLRRPPDAPFRETDPVDLPVSPYAATKKACELLAHTFHHLHGLPVTGLRFFTAYGPRNRPDLAIAKFARLIDRGEPVPMFGDGTTRRDYTFVDDIVDGIVRAIERCAATTSTTSATRSDRAARR